MTSSQSENPRPAKKPFNRHIFLILAVLTSPLICCLFSVLPFSLQPPMFNLFGAEAAITNQTNQTLYLTPITTTTGEGMVIFQPRKIRQVNLVIKPNQTRMISYDAADRPLEGLIVCDGQQNCRWLDYDYQDQEIADFLALSDLDPGFLETLNSARQNAYTVILYPILGLMPLVLFLVWGRLAIKTRQSKKQNGEFD